VLTFTRRAEGSPFSTDVRLNAFLPAHVKLVLKYGPIYLTESEFQRRLAVMLAWYGISLVAKPRNLADADFRAHHRGAFRELARLINRRDVLNGVVLQLRRMCETRRLRPGAGR
jgi:hypothetical protein